MITGKSGSFDLSYGNFTARFTWVEEYDPNANTSVVKTNVAVKSLYWYDTYFLDGTISVDGKTVVEMSSYDGSHRVPVTSTGTFYNVVANGGYSAPPWSSQVITHNLDGTKTVSITVDIYGYTLDGSCGSGWHMSGSRTIELTHIPWASTIGATDTNIGGSSVIAVSRKSTAYTHSIQYSFGDLSGYVTADGGTSDTEVIFSNTSIPFAIPEAFYAQIPNAKSGICILSCTTYSGTTQIGEVQTAKFTATAAEESCKPLVSGTVVDNNSTTIALTGNKSKLVRYCSTALCQISAETRNSSTLSEKKIGGITVSGTVCVFPNMETDSVLFHATDSRGYTESYTVDIDLVPYIRLTCNPSCQRTDTTSGNAVLTLQGDWYNGSFGAASNTLTAKYRVAQAQGTYGSYSSISLEKADNAYSAELTLSELDYTKAFNVEITVSDALSTVTKTVSIQRGIPVFDWGAEDFRFNVPVHFEKSFTGGPDVTTDETLSVQGQPADAKVTGTALAGKADSNHTHSFTNNITRAESWTTTISNYGTSTHTCSGTPQAVLLGLRYNNSGSVLSAFWGPNMSGFQQEMYGYCDDVLDRFPTTVSFNGKQVTISRDGASSITYYVTAITLT